MNALTASEQELVLRHMGLVKMHVRRYLRRLLRETADRERDDLTQEGFIGLMEAASRYEPGRNGPFAAYALPHIRGAICRYLSSRMGGMAVSDRVKRRMFRYRKQLGLPGCIAWQIPSFFDIESSEPALARQAYHEHCRDQVIQQHGDAPPSARPTTITLRLRRLRPRQAGSPQPDARLRERYEQAVHWAVTFLQDARRCRSDRAAMIDAIVQERILVPSAQYRTAKSALVRRFGCSMGRLSQCERRLIQLIRFRLITGDPDDTICIEAASPATDLVRQPAMTWPSTPRLPDHNQPTPITDARLTW